MLECRGAERPSPALQGPVRAQAALRRRAAACASWHVQECVAAKLHGSGHSEHQRPVPSRWLGPGWLCPVHLAYQALHRHACTLPTQGLFVHPLLAPLSFAVPPLFCMESCVTQTYQFAPLPLSLSPNAIPRPHPTPPSCHGCFLIMQRLPSGVASRYQSSALLLLVLLCSPLLNAAISCCSCCSNNLLVSSLT